MIKLINATPHDINICNEEGICLVTYEKTDVCVRCPEEIETIGMIHAIPIISKKFIGIDGLPEEQEGTFYIVSLPVAQAGKALGRKDLLIPGEIVRNDKGQIIGCTSLARV